MTKIVKIDISFIAKTAKKTYPLGPQIPMFPTGPRGHYHSVADVKKPTLSYYRVSLGWRALHRWRLFWIMIWKVAFLKKNSHLRKDKNHVYSQQKWPKSILHSWPEGLKRHILWSRKYLYSSCKGVPHWPQKSIIFRVWCQKDHIKLLKVKLLHVAQVWVSGETVHSQKVLENSKYLF